MIKCNVTVCGTICRAAQVRSNKDGKPFITFGLTMVIPSKNGINKNVEISVAKDGQASSEISTYEVGKRAKISGTLVFHKRGNSLYWNLSCSNIDFDSVSSTDEIKGTMEFTGTAGKDIETKNDKKGNPYVSFSGYSSEKDGENFAYTWVRFRQFGTTAPEWLQPKSKVQAKGEAEFSIYNDKIDMTCLIQELKPWEKQTTTKN